MKYDSIVGRKPGKHLSSIQGRLTIDDLFK